MFGILILAVLIVFVAVIAYRTSKFTPKAQPAINDEEITFDKDGATAALAELIKCKTISYADHSLEDDAEFEKLLSKEGLARGARPCAQPGKGAGAGDVRRGIYRRKQSN